MEQPTYYQERMAQLGITEEINRVDVWHYDWEDTKQEVLKPLPVFVESEKGIEIYVYTLKRHRIYSLNKETGKKNQKAYCITRLKKPVFGTNGKEMKYVIPRGSGTYPFFHPSLIASYEAKEEIPTLYLTEGFFKAWKGCMHGLPVVGLSSITHMKGPDGKLHEDILELIRTCKVRRVVWLMDGDCMNITKQELTDGIDLYKRPNGFFTSASTFYTLLSDFEHIEKYAAYVVTDAFPQKAKGLDDALVEMKGKEAELVSDLQTFAGQGKYFEKINITYTSAKLRNHFRLHNVNAFFLHHLEKHPDLKKVDFKFNGTLYRWEEDKGECKVIIPGETKYFCRVGDDYYEFVQIPNKYAELETQIRRRQKSTIIDDHGNEFVKLISKYKAFCNVPDHNNFQQVIHNNFNVYAPFEHQPENETATAEMVPATIGFLKHIFGHGTIKYTHPKTKERLSVSELDLGLDYIQLLYQQPTQILPILCLVSKENGTGKTTFAKWLKLLFTANVAIVGNSELKNNFNKAWATKLLIICDEAKIDKQEVVERVKMLSTADKIFMEGKGKDHEEIDFFGKFIFLTNNEKNFIQITDEDVRYWVRKIPVARDLNINLLAHMLDEIPLFLSYLNTRKMVTDNLHRAWFHPELLKTDALRVAIEHSRPALEKEIIGAVRGMFLDFGVEEIMMTTKDIAENIAKRRVEEDYIERILSENLKVDRYHRIKLVDGVEQKQYITKRYEWPRYDNQGGEVRLLWMKGAGRPWVFKRGQFVKPGDDAVTLDEDLQLQRQLSEPPASGSTGEDLPF